MTDRSAPRFRDARSDDLGRLTALNGAAVPHVNIVPCEFFERFRPEAAYFRIAEREGEGDGGRIDAFLLALGPDADYDSPHFLWFRERYESFLYIDRIVVDAAVRGLGLGTLFYRDLERVAHERGVPRLTCEVNLRPANEGSLRFHRRYGFEEVGWLESHGGAKEVALMVCGVEGQGIEL